jgi:quinohemoprotein amine dehydrogenase
MRNDRALIRSSAIALAAWLLAPTTAAQDAPAAPDAALQADAADTKKKAKEKPGVPVSDVLVQSLCGRCHTRDDREHMTRISYVRKSPEGWAQTIKRMGRLHGLQLTPTSAKALVRSLSNSHGLTRGEAARGLYESERRVHWSEEHHEEDFKRACAQCHPLGRALLQYRDKDEWQLLRATHVAMFPLSQRQLGGGPPRDSSSRRWGPPPSTSGDSAGGGNSSRGGSSSNRSSRGGVGDRVLAKLSEQQPLFTDDWKQWTQNRREVPLSGSWTVTGHETGRGDVWGSLTLTKTETDGYSGVWELQWSDGSTARRESKGILYAGYSWRGRSTEGDTSWREVLLLDEAWQTFEGRLFSGAYDEVGVDVQLHRDDGRPRLVGARSSALEVPSKDHVVHVLANSKLPKELSADDFFVGEGLTVRSVERTDPRGAAVTIEVAAGAALGTRTIAYGADPRGVLVTLYDTVDYVRIRPLQGLSRVGGAQHPRQIERFEAFAVHRGADGKPYTDDDVDLFQVRPKWSLQEFRVRDDDDDVAFVGAIDPNTGVFTPNLDGPNPDRKWDTNNIGDVFVCCELSLNVPERPTSAPKESDTEDAAAASPPAREEKTFVARAHLLVTVPLYARWQVLNWEDR